MKLQFISLLLLAITFSNVTYAQDNATNILDKAIAQAKAEDKKVFVKYSASWCGWCKKMDKQMKTKETKSLFRDNYVIVNFVVKESHNKKDLETPGANEYLIAHEGENSGLPFWSILDENGNMIENSFNEKGENLGCPATEDEVRDFIVILKKTSNLSDQELAIISENFL